MSVSDILGRPASSVQSTKGATFSTAAWLPALAAGKWILSEDYERPCRGQYKSEKCPADEVWVGATHEKYPVLLNSTSDCAINRSKAVIRRSLKSTGKFPRYRLPMQTPLKCGSHHHPPAADLHTGKFFFTWDY